MSKINNMATNFTIRTQEVLCPECFKGRVEPKEKGEGKCNHCSTEFVYQAPTTIKYK